MVGLIIEAVLGLFSLIPLILGQYFLIKIIKRFKFPHAIYLFWVWFFATLWVLLQTLSVLFWPNEFLAKLFRQCCVFMAIPITGFVILLVDSDTKHYAKVFKISVLAILSPLVILYSFEEEAINLSSPHITIGGNFRLISSILFFYAGILYLYYAFRILFNSSKNVIKGAIINLIGGLFMGILMPFSVLFNWGLLLPGVNLPIFAFGALITVVSFIKWPQIAFILPFKAIQLLVLDIKSGNLLYTYIWDESIQGDQEFLSRILKGVLSITNESVRQGDIDDVTMEKGTMMMIRNKETKIQSVLIASKKSPSLHLALNYFNEEFSLLYIKLMSKYYEDRGRNDFSDEHTVEELKIQFLNTGVLADHAEKLIHQCFSFLANTK